MAARFPELSEDELSCLLDGKDSENTKKATKTAVSVFRYYIKERKISEDDVIRSKQIFANVLRKFYAEARKRDGELYCKSSLLGIRFGLQRFYSSSMDIIKDPEFKEANSVFYAEIAHLKREGKAKTEHKPPINNDDMKKLYESGLFSQNQPDTLQNKVFFDIMLHFCRRGRQNLRALRKTDFSVKIDASGVKYVEKIKDELTKNRRETDEAQETQTMFETRNSVCPVLSFEKYISHLNPQNEYLFQRPKRAVKESDNVWYDNMVVGQRTLGDKMKNLSRSAQLSYLYTNHSIRATTISILDECGYEARHIMAVSGHRSENSIRSYAAKTSLSKKRKMSEALSSTLSDETKPQSDSVLVTPTSNRLPLSPINCDNLLTDSQEELLLNEFN
jgi:hypothetical protein